MTPQHLEQLIVAHQRSLEMFALQWTVSPEDCVQEAFLRLHRSNKPIANEVSWLFRVVRNLAIDQGRSETSRSKREKFVGQQRAIFSPGSCQEIDTDELQLAIEKLPDEQREIVVAKIWGKLTLQQIADSFGIAASTAHRRYKKGIQELKHYFELPCQTKKNR